MFSFMVLFQNFPDFQAITGLGIGGILAAVTLCFYRIDRKQSEQRLAKLGQDFRQIVEQNTQAITLLTAFLMSQGHGCVRRGEDES